jgi:hypothetical protein
MNQRAYPRLSPSSIPFLKSISFNQGLEAQVIDISQGGMLIETEVRLRPQMKLNIKVATTEGIVQLNGSILRSFIVSLKGIVRYQSAVMFDCPFAMLGSLSTKPAEHIESEKPVPADAARENMQQARIPESAGRERREFVTIIAPCSPSPAESPGPARS